MASMSPSPAAVAQTNYITGIEQVMYKDPQHSKHRYIWDQEVAHASDYQMYRASNVAAGSSDVVVEVGNHIDQLFTVYAYAVRPGIIGIKSKKNRQNFPSDSKSARLAADRKAAASFAEDDDDDDEENAVARGITAYYEQYRGSSGVRGAADCEASDAATMKTTVTKSPSRLKYFAYFIPAWMYELVQHVTVMVGTLVFDTLFSKVIFAIHDVSVSEGHKIGLREVTGQLPRDDMTQEEEREWLIEQSSHEDEGWLPLPFWHTMIPELGMHVCAMDWSPIEYLISLAPWTKLIRRANPNTKVVKADRSELSNDDLTFKMVGNGFHIDPVERDLIADEVFDILFIQHHCRTKTSTSGFRELNARFHQPTTNLRWFFHRRACERDNEPFNWWGLFNMDAMKSAGLRFNAQTRQETMPAKFFRIIQALEKNTSCPRACQYQLGFSMHLDGRKYCFPEGSANMIRYPEVAMEVDMQDHLSTESVTSYMCQENFMLAKCERGVMVTAYANQQSR